MNSFLLLVSFKKSNMVVHSSPLLFRSVTFIIHVFKNQPILRISQSHRNVPVPVILLPLLLFYYRLTFTICSPSLPGIACHIFVAYYVYCNAFVRNTKELLKFLFRINKHIDNSNNPEQNRHHGDFPANRIQIKPINQKQDSCDNNSPHNAALCLFDIFPQYSLRFLPDPTHNRIKCRE